jgi:hypothetical protein
MEDEEDEESETPEEWLSNLAKSPDAYEKLRYIEPLEDYAHIISL